MNKPVVAQRADELLVVVAVDGIKLLDRPSHVDGPEFDVVSGVGLAVRAALVGDRFELLVAFGMFFAAEMRQSRIRRQP